MPGNKADQEAKQGFSKEDAIQFPSAENAEEGVAAEYEWINRNFPHCEIVQQTFFDEGDRQYDVIKVSTMDGTEIDIYFDITNFFGIF